MLKVVSRVIRHQGGIIDVVLVLLLLTWNSFTPFYSVSIVDFEHLQAI